MKNEYYPLSHQICHHVYNNGGCTFCGYKNSKKCVSKTKISILKMIKHFNAYTEENIEYIKKADRLIIAPNGSWFSQVPKELRVHIYKFMIQEKISLLQYECRATIFHKEKLKRELEIFLSSTTNDQNKVKELAQFKAREIEYHLSEIMPGHLVSLGLEIANDEDLKIINKGCCLSDYIYASNYILATGAKLCCNILIAPPGIDDPIIKAFLTAKFAVEKLNTNELHIMPCIPMKGTPAFNYWKNGLWNPISATAASEILKIIREQYPQIPSRYLDLRVFNFHGRHGKFKRKPGKWTEQEKQEVRNHVRKISEMLF